MGQPKLEDHLGLVHWHAERHARRAKRLDLLDDYKQAAAEGFLRALKSRPYDPELGTISTYAGPWMVNAMQNDVDSKAAFAIATPQKLLIRKPETELPKMVYADSPIKPENGGEFGDMWHVLEGLPTVDPTEDIDHGLLADELTDRIYASVPMEYHAIVSLILEREGNIGPKEVAETLGMSKSTAHYRMDLVRNLMRAACGAAPILESKVQRKAWYAHVRKQIRRAMGIENNHTKMTRAQRAEFNERCQWAGIPNKRG